MTLAAACQRCGLPVQAGAQYCANCGNNVSDAQVNVATRMVNPASVTSQMADMLLEQLREATLGDYEVLTELGRGGMATVYLGHDLQLDRKVAIKVMDPALLEGEGMAERFKLEARTAAQLSHPHIIPIFAVRDSDQLLYFVMKFVEGRPLDTILAEVGKFPIPMVQAIVGKVGEALGYAHRRGVVHRDIKPANIMIDVEGLPVVTDFGIAKVSASRGLTMTGATIGTPTYMSPEQCAAGTITGASDQYSLGVVAYEMLSGRTPFPGDSIVGLLYKHVHEPPPPFLDARPDCPPALHDAVMKMLAKKPDDRFPSLEAAVQAIGVVTLAFDDPQRVQLVEWAKKGSNLAILKRISTPRSPTPARTKATKRPGGTAQPAAHPGTGEGSRAAVAAPALSTATIGSGPSKALRWGGALAVVAALAALAVLQPWKPGAPAPPVAPVAVAPAVAGLVVQPASATLAVGATQQLVGAALDSTGGQMSAPIAWSSDDAAIASVSPSGLVQALAAGTATIRGRAGAVEAVSVVTVTGAGGAAPDPGPPVATALRVDGNPGSLTVGGTAQLRAVTLDGRNRPMAGDRVTWSSSDPARATINAQGVVTAVAPGEVTLTARAGALSQPVRLTVAAPAAVRVASIAIGGVPNTMTVGQTQRLSVSVTGDDGRPHAAPVAWRSADQGVATVVGGMVTAVGAGQTTITASADGRDGTATIRVTAPEVVTRPDPDPPRPDPTPAVNPREAIAAVIQSYARALESGQLSEVRRVYPGITGQQAQQVDGLRQLEQLRVTLRVGQLDVDGDQATATVSGQYQFYSRENRRTENLPVSFSATLENGPNGWRIRAIR